MPCSIDLNEANAINADRLALVKQKLEEAKTFINQVYIPDLLMIANVYKDKWSKIGGGVRNAICLTETIRCSISGSGKL